MAFISLSLPILFNWGYLIDEVDRQKPGFFNSKKITIKIMFGFINRLLGRQPENIKAKVEIYTWQTCPYCIRAKMLLGWKGVNYIEYKIDGDDAARAKMSDRANGSRTVPQIFINDQHIGGCTDLYQLDSEGKLDPLLAAEIS
jgi:glutaredoxin 3